MEAAVVARPDSKWGETPMAFIALKPNATRPDPEALTIFCKERLAGFKTPKHFEFGDLPKTPTGKVQKNVLRKRAAELVNKDISSRDKPGVAD
ncbi:2-succinylbenzoate--CoA ligase [compost metagenome]